MADRELHADAIDWTLSPAPEPRDVLELTFDELPDAYRNLVADRNSYRRLACEALTALCAQTRQCDKLQRCVRELTAIIQDLRRGRR